jgi:UDP-glucose/GDP-mannose dehydrogenase family protein
VHSRITIFGVGYVGAVSLACLARDGHSVIGVDIDATKLNLIRSGKTPVVKEGMVELIGSRAPCPRGSTRSRSGQYAWPRNSAGKHRRTVLVRLSITAMPPATDRTTSMLTRGRRNSICPCKSWYPGLLTRCRESLAVTTRRALPSHAKYPAVNGVSFYELRKFLRPLGFRYLDRFDLIDTAGNGGVAQFMVTVLRRPLTPQHP